MKFECPYCKNQAKPEYLGKKEVYYFELFLYECSVCKYAGFLGEFVKHEPSVADFHIKTFRNG